MRFIFVDEAGTSDSLKDEVARVVAGVIIEADTQLLKAESLLTEALQAVPSEFANGFYFHAEDIMNNRKYRDRWRLTDRINFLRSVMSIPVRLGAPIAGGMVWVKAGRFMQDLELSPGQEHHLFAFLYCITRADKWIRENGEAVEVAAVVAENNDIRFHLNNLLSVLRQSSFVLSPGRLIDRTEDASQGFNSQDAVFRVSRIRRTIHFVGKNDDPLVWIADAVAYGLKRYFSEKQFGEEFRQAIGAQIDLENFRGPSSGFLFSR